jgi:short-subunit dehydrogenase
LAQAELTRPEWSIVEEDIMSHSNDKKVAVVTGASSGIGAVYADRLAKRGYDLILVARRADRLHSLAQKITATYGRDVEVLAADLASEAELAHVEKVLGSNPHIHALVNNAGNARIGSFATASVEVSLLQIALNVTALTRLTHAVLPAFLQRNRGVIVNVASVVALDAPPILSVYSGTKAFVLQFSRGLQAELAETGIKVQVVLPSATATELWESSGWSLSAVDPNHVMTAENLVDAALAGFRSGEPVTIPSVEDEQLWAKFETARLELFGATQTGKPASRYTKA